MQHKTPYNRVAKSAARRSGSTRRNRSDEQVLKELLCQIPVPQTDEELLTHLLTREPQSALSGGASKPFVSPLRKLSAKHLRSLVLALVLVLVFGGLYLVGSTAFALVTIQQNLQAMQLDGGEGVERVAEAEQPDSFVPHSQREALALPPTDTAVVPALSGASVSATRTPTPPPRIGGTVVLPTVPPTETPVPTVTVSPSPLPTRAPPTSTPIRPDLSQQAVTVLLLGIDRRPGETFPARTDAIMVARIEPRQQRVALLSLPRDLMVEIPGYGQARINAANVYGEQSGQAGGGIELTRRTVSRLLDIPIDYVAEVNFQGFIGAIDAIGGVTIDVEHELYDPSYPTMDYGYTVAHFEAGVQHMDGERALMYSRVRHMDSDFERMHRQQAVMLAVLERVRQQNTAQQVQSIADITTALRDYIQTDMPPERMVGLAWKLRTMQPDMVERYTLDENMVTMYVIPDDPYATFALPGTIERLTRQLMEGPAH
jgi:LCP family protein required for cell wall assembly